MVMNPFWVVHVQNVYTLKRLSQTLKRLAITGHPFLFSSKFWFDYSLPCRWQLDTYKGSCLKLQKTGQPKKVDIYSDDPRFCYLYGRRRHIRKQKGAILGFWKDIQACSGDLGARTGSAQSTEYPTPLFSLAALCKFTILLA